MLRRALLLLLLAVAVALGVYGARNPERRRLDQAARRGVSGAFVRLADGVTHYELSGPPGGHPVVLVHGFSVPYYIWDSTATALAAAGFRVLRYDLYGRGWSDRPAVDYGADLYDRQLGALLDSTGLRGPVDVAGVSMGGWVSATFAGRHPERVRSLILIDPAAETVSVPRLMTIPLLGPLLWQVLVMPGRAAAQRTDLLEPDRFPDWEARYRPQMRFRGFGRALLSTSRALAAAPLDRVYGRVGELGIPVLLLWGTEDRTVPFAMKDEVLRVIPGARFHAIDGAAHLPHMERAEVVNLLLLEFLAVPPG